MESYFRYLCDSHSKLMESVDLLELFSSYEVVVLDGGGRLNVLKDQVYILVGGIVGIGLIPDELSVLEFSSEESFCIGHVPVGMPLGLIEAYTAALPIFYYVEVESRFIKLPVAAFESCILMDDKAMMYVLRFLAHALAFSIDTQSTVSAYEGFTVIRSLIYRYNEKVKQNSLGVESLASFILNRSRYSRSYIYHVISNLKKGGYINMKKGRLISIEKIIPTRF